MRQALDGKKIESNWYYFDEEGKQIVGKKEIKWSYLLL
ncbi:N-acetylmuramoyl-L-alanine amidase [Streptococcus infantis SK1302]|uniref:N-acetylmuramoyl-L-alanine amidase n=1 Tax=Streptococcus infantis SK1302 TaxID=871237 RepID=A0ABN0B3K4_9STRE|nr:N-acetylmuramoyl-L-alanine amidase [Streptococcus infantis SK1302]